MKSLFGKHRMRASFYHIGALVFIGITLFTYLNIISTSTGFVINAVLFVIDYLAEMFDPHPDNPGVWYRRYFHRFFKDDTE